jgi:NADH-quinone oxidoreductase subunit H
MGDPLFDGGFDLGVLLIVVVKALIGFTFVLVGVIFLIWFERKVIADMQSRIGPNRAGPWGLLQTFTIVPIAGVFHGGDDGAVRIFGNDTYLQVADPPVGVLFLLAMSALAVYGIMLAGWSAGSKYPLLGSVRASASMVSYEAALGLSLVAVVLLSGSLSTHDIVASQAGSILDWNIVRTGFVPFAIFLVAATAELNRPPFDLVEAEQEIVGGFNTEYSSIRFGMFYLAEFMNTITMSAIMVTLFLGGPDGPAPIGPPVLWSLLWFTVKLLAFLFLFVWLRASLPRYRYDQLMDLGWKQLIPLALAWLLLIASIQIGRDEGWNIVVVLAVGFAVAFAAGSLLLLAIRRADDDRDDAAGLTTASTSEQRKVEVR